LDTGEGERQPALGLKHNHMHLSQARESSHGAVSLVDKRDKQGCETRRSIILSESMFICQIESYVIRRPEDRHRTTSEEHNSDYHGLDRACWHIDHAPAMHDIVHNRKSDFAGNRMKRTANFKAVCRSFSKSKVVRRVIQVATEVAYS
jgi:hypothetical protein